MGVGVGAGAPTGRPQRAAAVAGQKRRRDAEDMDKSGDGSSSEHDADDEEDGNFTDWHATDSHAGELMDASPWLAETPAHIRKGAIDDLLAAHESNRAKQEKARAEGRPVHKYSIHFRNKRKPSSWTITVHQQKITTETVPRPHTRKKDDNKDTNRRKWTSIKLFPTFIKGPIYLTRPIEKVDGAVRITRNRRGQFFMHVPTKVPFTDIPARKAQAQRTVVALDPGVRTFQTTFSPTDGCGEYCAKENGFAAVFKEALKCDETITALRDPRLSKLKHMRLMHHKYCLFDRAHNMVRDLHRKVAYDLLDRYDTVLIPSFETSRMAQKKNLPKGTVRKIRNKTVRAMLGLRHYAFRTYLASRAEVLGKEVHVVSEAYTSQTCGRCGNLKKNLGGSETYKCRLCDYKCGRDENGARNVFLKHLRHPPAPLA